MIFLGIDDVFGEAEPVGPPGLAVCGDRAYEKVARPAFDDIVAELDAKVVYCYFDDKLSLPVRILNRPKARLINAFTAHLHRDSGSPARLEFCPAEADCGGGNFAVRLENEFPAAFVCFPCADEKIRELLDAIDGDFDAVADRTPAAGKCDSKENTNQQENKSFHNSNFRRPRHKRQDKKKRQAFRLASWLTKLLALAKANILPASTQEQSAKTEQ